MSNKGFAMGKKKRGHRLRKIYLDIIVVEVENVHSRKQPSWMTGWFSAPQPIVSNYYSKLKIGNQQRTLSTITTTAPDIIWNEDATFQYNCLEEKNLNLRIDVIEQDKGVFTTEEKIIYQTRINLSNIPEDKLIDIWLDLTVITGYGEAPPPPQKEPTRVHLMLFRSYKSNAGMLNYYGVPNPIIPLRLDAGDVILVQSSHFLTHSIKLTTMSQWDHVAMVVNTPGGKSRSLRLFESTADGVATYRLNETIEAYLDSCTIAIRRLALIRTDEMRSALSEFVKEVEGRPYKFSIMDFMKTRFGSHVEDDLSSIFCSQLIGAAYQRMEIIPAHVSVSNLLPTHFEYRRDPPAANLHASSASDVLNQPPPIHSHFQNKLGPMAVFYPFSVINPNSLNQPKESSMQSTVLLPEKTIRHVDIISSELIDNSYTVYNIQVTTETNQITIQRRYSDFCHLDSQLQKLFKGTPKLPPKTLAGKISSSVVEARQKALKIYLELLLDDPLTRCCDLVLDFLLTNFIHSEEYLSDSESQFSTFVESRSVKKSKSKKHKKKKKSKKSSKKKKETEDEFAGEFVDTIVETNLPEFHPDDIPLPGEEHGVGNMNDDLEEDSEDNIFFDITSPGIRNESGSSNSDNYEDGEEDIDDIPLPGEISRTPVGSLSDSFFDDQLENIRLSVCSLNSDDIPLPGHPIPVENSN